MSTLGLDDPDSLIEMRRRHLAIALRMQKLACIALAELEAKVVSGQKLDMSAADARTLLDAGAKLERDATGKKEPDDDGAPKATKPN